MGAEYQYSHYKIPTKDVLSMPAEEVQSAKVNEPSCILTCSVTVWYGAATAKVKDRMQCIIYSVEKVIGCILTGSIHLQNPDTGKKDHG